MQTDLRSVCCKTEKVYRSYPISLEELTFLADHWNISYSKTGRRIIAIFLIACQRENELFFWQGSTKILCPVSDKVPLYFFIFCTNSCRENCLLVLPTCRCRFYKHQRFCTASTKLFSISLCPYFLKSAAFHSSMFLFRHFNQFRSFVITWRKVHLK